MTAVQKVIFGIIFVSLNFFSFSFAHSQDAANLEDNFSRTNHSVRINGENIPYEAIAGTMIINDDMGNPIAKLYSTTYRRTDVDDLSTRPITFAYNGGPGSASIWLHMGGIGPKRVKYDDDGFAPHPPYSTIENEYSILETTDLVFIDPIFTGFSRPLPGQDKDQFLGVMNDANYITDFVASYLSKFDRWDSPKFLLGESYGTVRAGAMSEIMHKQKNIFLNGIMVVSGGSMGLRRVGTIKYALNLPHFTATAWYHKQLSPELQAMSLEDVLKVTEEFALGEFSSALLKGNNISTDEKNRMAERVSELTGLTKEYVLNANLRVERNKFRVELMRDEGKMIGRLDSRHLGLNKDNTGETPDYDPSGAALDGAFPAAFNSYVRNELGYVTDVPYTVSADVGWNRYAVDTWEHYRSTMARNQYMKVLFTDGYYDKMYYWAEHAISQWAFPQSIADRIDVKYYSGGHMMYVEKASLIKMQKDLNEFIQSALP